MNRIDIVNELAKKYNYSSYVEIGVQRRISFNGVTIKDKIGIDPDPDSKATHIMTSDHFFRQLGREDRDKRYSLIFVDGDHTVDQAHKDITNALNYLEENGSVVVHDCNPITEAAQQVPRIQKLWNGDVWKAIARLRQERDDLEIFTVNCDHGCAVIRKGKGEPMLGDVELTFESFEKYRKEILNLISPKEFLSKMGKNMSYDIYEVVPYSFEKDYGAACNKQCELIPNDNDWIVVRDTDVMSLTPSHLHKIKEAIDRHPETGLFTVLTNRVKQHKQVADMSLFENSDIKVHRQLALDLAAKPIDVPIIPYVISGYCMIFKKSTWKKVGGFKSGILGVDNNFSWRMRQHGFDVRLMKNVYYYHYYRHLEGVEWKGHLK